MHHTLFRNGARFFIGLAVLLGTAVSASAQSQTAQSVMVKTTLDSAAYEIEGTLTWTYDRPAAMTYYTNAWDGAAPAVNSGSGATPATPTAPAPDENELRQHAQAQRCIFFAGGTLGTTSYTKTLNGPGGWKWTFTYNITPNVTEVAPNTAWSSETEGDGSVDVGFSGFVASESYLKQSSRTKYSFTLLDSLGLSRVQDVAAQLQRWDGQEWIDIDEPLTADSLDVSQTIADYEYAGNAGVFGHPAVYSALHIPGAGSDVSAILLSDTFVNNDNDLVNGGVHQADYAGSFPGITEAGDYRIVVSGVVKGNSSKANQPFSIESDLLVIGGCTQP